MSRNNDPMEEYLEIKKLLNSGNNEDEIINLNKALLLELQIELEQNI